MSNESPSRSMNVRDQELIRSARLQIEVIARAADWPQGSDGTTRTTAASWTIPGYAVVREIHRGGQGTVYQAQQESTGRPVALKVLREDVLASPQERLRFEREAQILSHIDHPGVVRIIDRGCEGNRQWLAMDLVRGQPLSRHFLEVEDLDDKSARQRSDQINERLQLMAAVCDAVHAAHLHGVIHRDLKPGNILVDDSCQPRVLDFGLAKINVTQPSQGRALPADEAGTMTGLFVGSLPWASPEQVDRRDGSIDLRSDVYSLGVMLYQMLAGRPPYSLNDSLHEITQNITSVQPQRPSALNPHLNHDLDTIVLRSLAKDRERRYQSAGDLARDLRQYLVGGPIEARRDSAVYVLRQALRRYRVQFAAVVALFVTLIISGVVAWTLYGREQIASANAREAQKQATAHLHESLLLQARASRQSGLSNRRQSSLEAVRRAAKINPTFQVRNEAIAALATMGVKPQPVRFADQMVIAVSPDGELCATVGDANSAQIRRVSDGTSLAAIPGPVDGGSDVYALHRIQLTSRFLARAYDRRDGGSGAGGGGRRLEVWRIAQADLWLASDDLPEHGSFNISADEQWIAFPSGDKSIRIVDLENQQEVRRIKLDHNAGYVKFDPARRWLAQFHDADGVATVHDLRTGAAHTILTGANAQWTLDFSSDGSLVAAADGHVVRLWDMNNAQMVGELNGHSSQVVAIRFSPDASMLTSYSWDGASIVWDVKKGQPLVRLDFAVLAWPAGTNHLMGSTNRGLHECAIEQSREYVALVGSAEAAGHEKLVTSPHLVFDPLNRFLVSVADQTTSVRVFDPASGLEVAAGAGFRFTDVAIDRAGQVLVTTGLNGLFVWDVAVRAGALRIGPPQAVEDSPRGWNVDISPDGRFAATVIDAAGTTLKIVDVKTRTIAKSIPVIANGVSPKFSSDGRWVAVGNWNGDGNVQIIDTTTWQPCRTLETTLSTIVHFSPDNQFLVSSDSREIALWRASDWAKVATAPITLQGFLTFSPDGHMLATVPIGGNVHLLDAHTLQELAVLEAPDGSQPRCAAFSPGSDVLMVTTADSAVIQKWNLALIRSRLQDMNLDWNGPPLTPHTSSEAVQPLPIQLDVGRMPAPPN